VSKNIAFRESDTFYFNVNDLNRLFKGLEHLVNLKVGEG
jgi:hypothetical protein